MPKFLEVSDAAAARAALEAGAVGSDVFTAEDEAAARAALGATAVGSDVLTAEDQAAARTAIGAGTSSLEIGTTSTTAKAGNYQPSSTDITDSTATGRSVITAADPTAARTAIGAASAEYATVTVGPSGSGSMLVTDGTADDVQIQQAINTVTAAGGGIVRIYSGVYDIRATITVPKDPKIRIEGQYTTKTGFGGTTLKVFSGLTTNIAAIISEAGTVPAVTSNGDHSHASHYHRLIFDGLNKADAGLALLNTDHTIVSDCKFVNVGIGIDGQYNGTVAESDYAGGLRVQGCSLAAGTINIRLDSHTQDWITDSWFLGTPSDSHIRFISSNKIHLSNNEFNSVGGSVFIFDDTAALFCGDINITGGFINAGAGKPFWTDNRTNAASRGIIVSGVRMVAGVTTRLFQQAKSYQGVTYTSANKVGGVVTPDFNDTVILINGSSGTVPLQLPTASTAINTIWIKAINVANAVTVLPTGSEQIEQAGVLGTVFTFGEVNESILIAPDGDKWRVLENHKPSALIPVTPESVVETSSANYTLGTGTDVLLVNASSNAVTVTLPSKASKLAATRKTVTIKVINATNAVTITAAGSDQIDNVGQTAITINDTRAVVLHANSGSRWRSWYSLTIGTTSTTAKAGDYQPTAANISDSTVTGRSVITAADSAAARTAIGAGTSNLTIGTTSTTAKAGDYQPTASNISDSTATGRSVITAADAAAARTAIGAGTSNLTIGTTSTTAKAGDYQPSSTNITDSTVTGRSLITATNAAAARTAIGAGTSNLAIGTTSTTAKAGDYQPTSANISDSTVTGRSLITATDAPAARTAIGAGTSNLTIGTTSATAKAGDYKPTWSEVATGQAIGITHVLDPNFTDATVLRPRVNTSGTFPALSTEFKRAGEYSMKITAGAGTSDGFFMGAVSTTSSLTVGFGIPGHQGMIFYSECWVYVPSGQNNSTGNVQLGQVFRGSGATTLTDTIVSVPLSSIAKDTWVKLSATKVVPAGGYELTFPFARLDTGVPEGSVCYVDHFIFKDSATQSLATVASTGSYDDLINKPSLPEGGMLELKDDTTPQLGGNLDLNGRNVGNASAADLTKLSEVTATSTQLNHTVGVTSAIQTQLNSKATSRVKSGGTYPARVAGTTNIFIGDTNPGAAMDTTVDVWANPAFTTIDTVVSQANTPSTALNTAIRNVSGGNSIWVSASDAHRPDTPLVMLSDETSQSGYIADLFVPVLALDDGVGRGLYAVVNTPPGWTTALFDIYWTHLSTSRTGNIRFNVGVHGLQLGEAVSGLTSASYTAAANDIAPGQFTVSTVPTALAVNPAGGPLAVRALRLAQLSADTFDARKVYMFGLRLRKAS
jgi:hypothetical protein